MIISITNILVNADDVNAGSSLAGSESTADHPKAEALTLVIHDLPTSPRLANIPPQVKVVKERSDDIVHVYHTRPKRQRQSSRKRRPSSNSNFRSRIKSPPSSQSNFGGFKDFSSSDFRNPPRGFGEPPRATNKYKFGPPQKSQQQQFEGYNYSPPQKQSNKKSQKRERPPIAKVKNIGPPNIPQSQNQLDAQFAAAPSSASQAFFVNHSPAHNFPPQHDAAQSSNDDHFIRPLNDFPLEKGPNFNFPKTSYGYPVRQHVNSNPNSNPGITKTNQFSVLGTNLDGTPNSNFPRLPNRYEQNEFSNPSRPNLLNNGNNQNHQNQNLFVNEFNVGNSPDATQNYPQQSNRHSFRQFNKFKNFDYDYKNRFTSPSDDDDDEEADYSSDYVFKSKRPVIPTTTTTTTTTPYPFTTKHRPKKSFGKKNRPGKVSQSHNLDTDDLRDAYGDSSDFHEIISSSAEDYKGFNTEFDSQRNTRRNQNPVNLHELPSTLKNHQNTLRSALGDNFEIVSVQKSLEKDPRDVNLNLGFIKKHDFFNREFSVGSELNFGHTQHNPAAVWPENFPKNHRLV